MISKTLVLLILLYWTSVSSFAVQLQKELIGSGGGRVQSDNYQIDCSIGQAFAGYTENSVNIHWVGFWFKESIPIITVFTAAEAKTKPDGTIVRLLEKIVSAGISELGDRFYIQEADRSSGIQVYCAGAAVPNLIEGQMVNVEGLIATRSGERCIINPSVNVVASGNAIFPLSVTSSSLGGGPFGQNLFFVGQKGITGRFGLNNIGLLVLTWGRVEDSGPGYIVINDGKKGTYGRVKVDTSRLIVLPNVGDYISIVGISSLEETDSGIFVPLLLPRRQTDLQVISEN